MFYWEAVESISAEVNQCQSFMFMGFWQPQTCGYREDTHTMIFEVNTSKNGLLQILSDI